jgi:hypothetical protein
MKRNYLILGLVACTLLGSCKKQLELEDPQGLSPETALANDANIKRVLQGGYDAISSSSLYGGDLQLMSDLMGSDGELSWKGTFPNYRELWGKQIITTNSLVTGTWISAYNAINIANNILANIDKVNEADAEQVRGEALFIRGAMHFELVRLYAKDYTDGDPGANPGVPVVTTPTNSAKDVTNPSRSSVSDVYNAVIADLTEAATLLPVKNGVFANRPAALAMLSRVYLQKADYAGARDAANTAIMEAGTNYQLLLNFIDNFNQAANTPEDLFAIQVNDQDGANNLHTYYSISDFGARDGDIEVTAQHVSIYEANDERASVTEDPEDAGFNTGLYFIYDAYRTTKFRDLYRNVKVIRLAEMYLTRAEANYRLGTAVGANPLDDINTIRTRAGVAPLTSIANVEQIYLERRRELAFEGFALHDAKRFKQTVDGLPWNDNKLVLPIPFREMNANPSLTQNPGY